MKRFALACLISLIGISVATAQTGAVYSLNVVGFQKVDTPDAALVLGSTPFDPNDPNMNEVLGDQLTGGTGYANSDNLLLWDSAAQTYKLFFLAGDVGVPAYNYKWIDTATSQVATNGILPGDGFWLRSRQASTQTVVMVGDVVNDPEVTNQVVQGLQLLSYPYSTSIAMNDTTFTNGAVGGTGYTDSDNILLWDVSSQEYRLFFLAGDVGVPAYNHKWIETATSQVATNLIQPGQSFWYRHRGAGFNWVEARPYTLD